MPEKKLSRDELKKQVAKTQKQIEDLEKKEKQAREKKDKMRFAKQKQAGLSYSQKRVNLKRMCKDSVGIVSHACRLILKDLVSEHEEALIKAVMKYSEDKSKDAAEATKKAQEKSEDK